MNLESILEGIIIVSGDEGISLKQISEVLEKSEEDVLKLLDLLKEEYKKDNHGLSLELLGGNYKFVTKKECHEYLEKLARERLGLIKEGEQQVIPDNNSE